VDRQAKETHTKYLVHPGSISLYIGAMGVGSLGNLDGPSFRFRKLEPIDKSKHTSALETQVAGQKFDWHFVITAKNLGTHTS